MIHPHQLHKIGDACGVARYGHPVYAGISALFKGIGEQLARLAYAHCKGDERGRYIQILERSAHTVLTADSAQSQIYLSMQCAQERAHGLAPPLRIGARLFEKFLQSEPDRIHGHTRCYLLGNSRNYGIHRTRERRTAQKHGRAAVSGHGRRIRPAAYGRFCRHGYGGSELIFAAERHYNARRAYRRVEHFAQPLGAAHVQPAYFGKDRSLHIARFEHGFCRRRRRFQIVGHIVVYNGILTLFYAVGVQKFAFKLHYAAPGIVHAHIAVILDLRNCGGGKILPRGKINEFFHVVFVENDRHALLRFGYGELGAAQTVVLLGHFVEEYIQAVRKFADSYGNATRAEVVALDYELAHFGIAEQPLNLALGGRIALLHFCAARFNRSFGMRLG